MGIIKRMRKVIIFGTGLYGKQALQFLQEKMLCSGRITTKIYMEN